MLQLTQVFLMWFKLVKFDFALYPENALCEVVNRRTIEIPQWTHIFKLTTDSFRVSLFIDLRCPWNLGKRSGCFMIIKWPISWFVYQWRHFRNVILLRWETACGLRSRRHFLKFPCRSLYPYKVKRYLFLFWQIQLRLSYRSVLYRCWEWTKKNRQ